jgi:hypothetical protein
VASAPLGVRPSEPRPTAGISGHRMGTRRCAVRLMLARRTRPQKINERAPLHRRLPATAACAQDHRDVKIGAGDTRLRVRFNTSPREVAATFRTEYCAAIGRSARADKREVRDCLIDAETELAQTSPREGLHRKPNICRVCHASAAKHVASDPERSRTFARVAAIMALRLCAQPAHRSQVWNALSDSPASCGSGLARDPLGRTRTTRPSATPHLPPNGRRREGGANEAR